MSPPPPPPVDPPVLSSEVFGWSPWSLAPLARRTVTVWRVVVDDVIRGGG